MKSEKWTRPTVGWIAGESAEDDEDVVDVQLGHDLVSLFFSGGHGLADARDVRVVPRVVVDEDGAVGHGRDLVAVVPPGHDARVLGRVHAQPVVGLAEVVENDARIVVAARWQHDARRAVRLRRHPRAVEGVADEEERDERREAPRHLEAERHRRLAAARPPTAVGARRRRRLVVARSVQVLHLAGQRRRHGDARQDAHHRRQNQHQTHHHALRTKAQVFFSISLELSVSMTTVPNLEASSSLKWKHERWCCPTYWPVSGF